LRFLAAALSFIAALQLVAGVAAAAVAPARSCVVPMPCCTKGVCPLHAHARHRHSNSGPRWLRCDDHVPMSTPPATGPLAVLTRAAGVPQPSFAHAVSPIPAIAAAHASPEPEQPPPDLPARLP
jgi:hypothetical protein